MNRGGVFDDSQRYPGEAPALTITLLILGGLLAVSAFFTVCGSLVLVLIVVIAAYAMARSHHQALLRKAHRVNDEDMPGLADLLDECRQRLGVEPVDGFVVSSRRANAYTFGLESPKVIVLYSELFQLMDRDELAFIIGHELGHIRLGHTWINSLVGGLAGVPAPSVLSALLRLIFLSWNRACEFSADRAGLYACGRLDKAVSALVKLVAGRSGSTQAGLERAYRQIDAEDDTWLGGLSEALSTHPLLIKRIEELRRYARGNAGG